MTLSPKYVVTFILAFMVILGWNVFLIQRDNKLFDAYYQQKAQIEQQKLIK